MNGNGRKEMKYFYDVLILSMFLGFRDVFNRGKRSKKNSGDKGRETKSSKG